MQQKGLMHKNGGRFRRFAWGLLMVFIFLAPQVKAQDTQSYEEIMVFLMVQRVGGIDIPAIYFNQQIYLPIQDIFDFLKIKNSPSPTCDSISGFFIDPEALYVVDKIHNRIIYNKKTTELKPNDLFRTESCLYLRSNFFGEVFGLDCDFNFRSLSVILNTKIELPVIRDMRLEFMRSNIVKMKGEFVADTIIPRSHPFLKFGVADWAVTANQEIGGQSQSRFNLGLGGILAGGEAKVALQYSAGQPITEKYQQYLWRLVNNDRKVFRQISAGKIATQATSSLFNPVIGVQVSNAPTTYRRSFGTYTLTDYTEPDWAVELYVNNVLVDFKKADASGFFTFEVPLMYGTTNVLLRFYGTFGEERSKEQMINIPYNFLPAKEFQYTASACIVEDSTLSRYSRFNANYGLGKSMAIGAGVEYLSSVTSGPLMPFVNTSIRLGSNFLFSGEYTYGVRGKGILNYRNKKNLQVELNYTRYDPNQKAINFSFLEERKASLSFPVKAGGFTAFSRLSVTQNIMPTTQYMTADWLVSGVIFGVSTNLTTYAMLADIGHPYVYTNLSLGVRLPGRISFRPQGQFEYSSMRLILAKAEFEKQFMNRGYLNVSYEYNFKTVLQNIQFGFRYEFSGAQASFNFRRSNSVNTFSESASGSLLVDAKTKYVGLSSRTGIGKGGIVLMPFLDLNANGKYDRGETKVLGLKININGGRVVQSKRDSVIRIFDLEPYTSYLIELNHFSFDNIAWQMKLKNVSVMVDPNQLKLVEIPITVMGEGAGVVAMRTGGVETGKGRITVNFYTADGKFFAKTLSEPDGYFSYLGLPGGSYIVRIDPDQMAKLNWTATPERISFTLKVGEDGDVKDGLDFIIESNVKDPDPPEKVKDLPEKVKDSPKEESKPLDTLPIVQKTKEKPKPIVVKDTVLGNQVNKAETLTPPNTTTPVIPKDRKMIYVIQIAASKTYEDPTFYQNKFGLKEKVWYYEKDGWFKYVVGQYSTAKEANNKMSELIIKGFVTPANAADIKSGDK